MYQPSSLEPGLETRSACGARAHDLLLIRLAPYPLDHSSLKNLLLPGFPKANWMSNLLFRLKLPICFFPGREKAKWLRLPICFFPGREKAKGSEFQFAFPGAGKSKRLRLPICFFPGREKAKWFRLPICFFPGREKAKWSRLPICFFPGREKAKGSDFQFAFSRAGKKQNGPDFQFAFFQAGKKQNGPDFQFAFFRAGKKQNGSASSKKSGVGWGLALSSFASTMRTFRHTCAISHDKEFSKGREKAIGNVSDFQFAFS